MTILKKTVRSAAVTVAVLFIGLSLLAIVGVWFVDHEATEISRKGFGLVRTAVGVVDAGVGRAHDLIAKSRTEVQQAAESITTLGAQAQTNRPALNALNERIETNLAPRIVQMQQVLAPVRDAMGSVANAVSILNALPMLADRAPRLAALDDTFNRLEEMSADATQLRGTLRGLVAAPNSDVNAETVGTLNRLTKRIDTRLGEVGAKLQDVRADIDALQARLDQRESRLLLVFNLLALLATLMLAWILYSQVVVIRHYRRRADGDTAV